MKIRIDLPRPTFTEPPPLPTRVTPCDVVLYDCPNCDRVHFVRVGDCPDELHAQREQAMAMGTA